MSVLPDSVKTGGNGCYIYSPLSVDDFLRRFDVSKEQEEIRKRFAYLLTSVGMDDCKELCDIPTLIETESHEAKDVKGIALTLMQKKKSN